MSSTATRFIELVLAPRDKGGVDAQATQRLALERLRDLRPGMLIDQIEEPAGAEATPARTRALLTRLRSHVEARTFDELRVFEIGRLIRADDPTWHEAIVDLVQQARAVLVDSSGLTADPAHPTPLRGGAPPRPPGPAADQRRSAGQVSAPTSRAASAAPAPPDPARGEPWRSEAPPAVMERRALNVRRPQGGTGQVQTAGFTALCEGRVFCETCGQPLAVQSQGHERKRFYACVSPHLHPATDCQPQVSFPVEAVDRYVWAQVFATLEQPDRVIAALREALGRGLATGEDRRAQHAARLGRLERDELEVLGLRSEDRVSESAARKRLDDLARERRSIEESLRDGAGAHQPLKILIQAIEDLTAGAGRSLDAADPAERRRLFLAALPESAEYGVHPRADGAIEIRSLLAEHDLTPSLRYRARALGSAVQDLTGKVAEIRAPSPLPAFRRLAGFLRERLAPTPPVRAVAASGEPGALRFHGEAPRPIGRWIAWAFGLTAAALVAVIFQPMDIAMGESENIAAKYGFDAELAELYRVPGGWVGQVEATWEGATDTAMALAVCRQLSAALTPGARDTITILRPEGVPLTECGPPLDGLD